MIGMREAYDVVWGLLDPAILNKLFLAKLYENEEKP